LSVSLLVAVEDEAAIRVAAHRVRRVELRSDLALARQVREGCKSNASKRR